MWVMTWRRYQHGCVCKSWRRVRKKVHHATPNGVVAVFLEDEAAPEDGGARGGGRGAREDPTSGARGLGRGFGGVEGFFAEISEPVPTHKEIHKLG